MFWLFKKKLTSKKLRETAFRTNKKRWRKDIKRAYLELQGRIRSKAEGGSTSDWFSPKRLSKYDIAARLFAIRHKDIKHTVKFNTDEEGEDRARHYFSWQ